MQGGQLFTVSVPTNWQPMSSNNSVKYVPQNAYGEYQGQIDVDARRRARRRARVVARSAIRPRRRLIDGFVRGNDGMRVAGRAGSFRLSGRNAIVTPLEGRSALGGVERVDVHTTMLDNGDLFYLLTVVPEREVGTYGPAFDRVVRSSVRIERSVERTRAPR